MDGSTRLGDRSFTFGVIGLGYVGLPLAVNAARLGFPVVGYDVSERRVQQLRDGRSHVEDISDQDLAAAHACGFRAVDAEEELEHADALVICVPSPLSRNRLPDLSYIERAADTVARRVRSGALVSLESTTYPGTTEDHIVPAVERAGLTLDRDVWVAYSPERVDPGNHLSSSEIPKVVGGVTPASGAFAAEVYGHLVPSVHQVKSARAAELTKLLENTYRAVNIALVNEMTQVAEAFDIDIWDVIDAAATKPFGFQAFYPGPGVGGHCIPLDPQYLAFTARGLNVRTRFIDLAEDVNRHMPAYVAGRVMDEMNRRGLPAYGSRVLAAGVAYKGNVGDDRESPAWDVLDYLRRRGAQIDVMDPHVAPDAIAARGYRSVKADGDEHWEVAIVLTDHRDLPYDELVRRATFVFDTRGVYRHRQPVEGGDVLSL